MAYTQILYHLVFSTKERRATLKPSKIPELLRYWYGTLKNLDCRPFQLNAVSDHAHLLFALHPSRCLSDLVKTLKVSSNHWIQAQEIFPDFNGWQENYGAFTLAKRDQPRVEAYIRNQQAHHRERDSLSEFKQLLNLAEIPWDERYLR